MYLNRAISYSSPLGHFWNRQQMMLSYFFTILRFESKGKLKELGLDLRINEEIEFESS